MRKTLTKCRSAKICLTPLASRHLEIANAYASIGSKNNNPAWANTFNPYLILDEDVNAKGSWGKAEEILEASFNQAKLVVLNDGRPTR